MEAIQVCMPIPCLYFHAQSLDTGTVLLHYGFQLLLEFQSPPATRAINWRARSERTTHYQVGMKQVRCTTDVGWRNLNIRPWGRYEHRSALGTDSSIQFRSFQFCL